MKIPDLPILPVPPNRSVEHPPEFVTASIYEKQDGSKQAGVPDQLNLSPEAVVADAAATFTAQALTRLERGVGVSESAARRAGREEFLRRIETGADAGPEATAERLVAGATGYVYRAWRDQAQSPDETEVERYRDDVGRNVRQELAAAVQHLRGLGVQDGDLDERARQAGDRALERLAEFAREDADRVREGDGAGPDDAL